MRTIPQIRERLYELAEEYGFEELRTLADETKRRSPVRRARTKHAPLTGEVKAAILAYAEAHPDAHQQDIALHFKTNAGRVSETLAGFRDDD